MNNQIQIKDLKRGQLIYSNDPGDWYKVYSDAEFVNGVWQVDTTGDGDDVRIFYETETVFLIDRKRIVK